MKARWQRDSAKGSALALVVSATRQPRFIPAMRKAGTTKAWAGFRKGAGYAADRRTSAENLIGRDGTGTIRLHLGETATGRAAIHCAAYNVDEGTKSMSVMMKCEVVTASMPRLRSLLTCNIEARNDIS